MGKSWKDNKWARFDSSKKNGKNKKKPFQNHQRVNDQHGQQDFDQSYENNNSRDEFDDPISLMS